MVVLFGTFNRTIIITFRMYTKYVRDINFKVFFQRFKKKNPPLELMKIYIGLDQSSKILNRTRKGMLNRLADNKQSAATCLICGSHIKGMEIISLKLYERNEVLSYELTHVCISWRGCAPMFAAHRSVRTLVVRNGLKI